MYIQIEQNEEEEEIPISVKSGEQKPDGEEEVEYRTVYVDVDQEGKALTVIGRNIKFLEGHNIWSIN